MACGALPNRYVVSETESSDEIRFELLSTRAAGESCNNNNHPLVQIVGQHVGLNENPVTAAPHRALISDTLSSVRYDSSAFRKVPSALRGEEPFSL